MSDAFIDAGDAAASKLQTYKNTVSGTEVHSEAVTPTGPDGVANPVEALSDSNSNPTVPLVGSFSMFWDITKWRRWFGALVADGLGAVYAPFVNAFVHMRDAAGARVELRGDATGVWVADKSMSAKAATVSASGTTTLHTPAAGKAVRLWWYNLGANPDNTASVVASLRWTTGGTDFFNTKLSQYGGQVSHSFKAGRSYVQGGTNEALVANLGATQTVYYNFDYEEVTP